MTDEKAREILEQADTEIGEQTGFTVAVTKLLAIWGIESIDEKELRKICDAIKEEYIAKAKARPAGDTSHLELFVRYGD